MVVDQQWMELALEQAGRAAELGEVPIGAVIVLDGQLVSQAHNEVLMRQDPTAHAEMLAIQRATQVIENYRLLGADLYVTLEPCAMCAGALVHSRIRRLIYATADPKTGAAGSVLQVVQHPALNHNIDIVHGIEQKRASQQLIQFFKQKRIQQKQKD